MLANVAPFFREVSSLRESLNCDILSSTVLFWEEDLVGDCKLLFLDGLPGVCGEECETFFGLPRSFLWVSHSIAEASPFSDDIWWSDFCLVSFICELGMFLNELEIELGRIYDFSLATMKTVRLNLW